MTIQSVPLGSYNTSIWKEEEDEQLRQAVYRYNQNSPKSFPKDPFNARLPFTTLKKNYLQDLDRSHRQLRQRWVCHICPKIRAPSILAADEAAIRDLYSQNPAKWELLSAKTFEVFERQQYYPSSVIRNFFSKRNVVKSNLNVEGSVRSNSSTTCQVNHCYSRDKQNKKRKLDSNASTLTGNLIIPSLPRFEGVFTQEEEYQLLEDIAYNGFL